MRAEDKIYDFKELKRLRNNVKMEKERLKKMEEDICLLGGGGDSERVDTSKQNGTEQKYINIISRQQKQRDNLRDAIKEYYKLEILVFDKIKKVGKVRAEYSAVLHSRFVVGYTQEQTANVMAYTVRQIQNIQRDAIDEYLKIS